MIKPALEALAIRYKENTLSDHKLNSYAKNHHYTEQALDQCTLKHTVQLTGYGHYQKTPVTITLRPAPIDTGIVFRRVDISPMATLKADLAYISTTVLQTNLIKKTLVYRALNT